jgi:hypothetical protein
MVSKLFKVVEQENGKLLEDNDFDEQLIVVVIKDLLNDKVFFLLNWVKY